MHIKMKDLKMLDKIELAKKQKNLSDEILKLRTQAAAGAKLEKPKKIREIKKDIARILTFQNQVKKIKEKETKKNE
ncbi:MAG: 50S ribosomal protein L29 [Candidatus Huberarchaeum crystalense]|uniref:Large ribosomal subunit protein uL29 n=1 Tax=Huberarchaeum crystalense TaxID=2014257 RepID=A0A2G9LJP7_HUBC1|nr:MAG: 50S ribosomal protein L29 [archaeon CG2_30_31_98]PIN66773.1 MAG: 50S ribosomal protein L29 [Candidatus Huberarchaeum crystalense]PIV13811.1 MAG: 50S ribosomal protein L29 [Candidatus Huberarchaeum crystalense]PIV46365.1 MAG: 50S ribosomal protein L29 [Candidatus Huberarchaeum crystalense]PIV89864.1 MAG: 50S ribosomal protein L29 [Candidatus Huberarchaeum crystalense]